MFTSGFGVFGLLGFVILGVGNSMCSGLSLCGVDFAPSGLTFCDFDLMRDLCFVFMLLTW